MALKEFSFGLLAGNSLPDIVRLASRAESLGFGTLWVAEDYFYGGAFATATACVAATRTMRVGIGVINPYTRHPCLTAMEAGALDAASGGRLVLGVGASNRRWMEEMQGIPFQKPVAAIGEMVEIVRRLLAGERLSYAGQVFRVRDVELGFTPLRDRLPIHLGVKGPRMLELAGRIADGVLLSVLSSPAYVRWAVDQIRRGARQEGRTIDSDYEVGVYLLIYPSRDRQRAREAVRPAIAKYLGLHGEHPIMLESGLTPGEIAPFRKAFLAGEDASHRVDDRLIDLFSVAGTPEECAERLQWWIDAGVTHIVAFEVPGVDAETVMSAIARDLIPKVL
ncbi:MAG TPA: LLM class flavin-dependent oxidoreductase [Gemmatimonadaceae bacterium]